MDFLAIQSGKFNDMNMEKLNPKELLAGQANTNEEMDVDIGNTEEDPNVSQNEVSK